jgi:hypothetical protein
VVTEVEVVEGEVREGGWGIGMERAVGEEVEDG